MVWALAIITIFCVIATATSLWMIRQMSKNYNRDLVDAGDRAYLKGFEAGMRSARP